MKKHTDKELKTIAVDLAEGKIFCDRQINNSNMVGSVFPVLMPAGAGATYEFEVDDQREEMGKL